jgi:hypothetical protein
MDVLEFVQLGGGMRSEEIVDLVDMLVDLLNQRRPESRPLGEGIGQWIPISRFMVTFILFDALGLVQILIWVDLPQQTTKAY